MTKPTRPPDAAPAPAPAPDASYGVTNIPSIAPLLNRGPTVSIIVPPGGFAGFAQQTAATQAMFQRAGRKGGKRSAAKRRKRATAKRAAPSRKRRARAKTSKRRLVKGSAAAKRYMASIRRKRKR